MQRFLLHKEVIPFALKQSQSNKDLKPNLKEDSAVLQKRLVKRKRRFTSSLLLLNLKSA